jgi:hypothetical protein
MQRKVRAGGKHGIDLDQVLHGAHFGREHDLVGAEPELDGTLGAQQRRLRDRLMHHRAGILGLGQPGILVHEAGEQILVEASPVDPDAHRLVVLDGDVDDGRELPVALVLEADIAGIDAVFGERLGTGRVLGEQRMAVIVEVADEGHVDATSVEFVADMRHGNRSLRPVDRHAHELRAGAGKGRDLGHGGIHIGSVGVGHRLHHDGRRSADDDTANIDRN